MPSLQVALANLDAVLLESRGTFEMLPEHVLAQLEEVQLMQSPRASASPQADGEHSELSWFPASLCYEWARADYGHTVAFILFEQISITTDNLQPTLGICSQSLCPLCPLGMPQM